MHIVTGQPSAARAKACALVRELHCDAAGAIELQIIRPREASALAELAGAGNERARIFLNAGTDLVRQIAAMPTDHPAQCAACARRIRKMRFSAAVVLPYRADASCSMGFAICWRCGTEIPQIRAAAIGALRSLWPAAREIRLTNEAGGRA